MKYSVGDKVIPIKKSAGDRYKTQKEYIESRRTPAILFKKQGFLTITDYKVHESYVLSGDFFLEDDLIPYNRQMKFDF